VWTNIYCSLAGLRLSCQLVGMVFNMMPVRASTDPNTDPELSAGISPSIRSLHHTACFFIWRPKKSKLSILLLSKHIPLGIATQICIELYCTVGGGEYSDTGIIPVIFI
jgi:hypothetical protein